MPKNKESCFSSIFKRCQQCTNRFVSTANRSVFCSQDCKDKYLWLEQERANRFRRESIKEETIWYAGDNKFEGMCDICYKPVFEKDCTPMPRIAHLKCGSEPKSINTEKLRSIEVLIMRGATEGERSAAKAAYKRLTGREYQS